MGNVSDISIGLAHEFMITAVNAGFDRWDIFQLSSNLEAMKRLHESYLPIGQEISQTLRDSAARVRERLSQKPEDVFTDEAILRHGYKTPHTLRSFVRSMIDRSHSWYGHQPADLWALVMFNEEVSNVPVKFRINRRTYAVIEKILAEHGLAFGMQLPRSAKK